MSDESASEDPSAAKALPTAGDPAPATEQLPLASAPAVVKRSFPMGLSICVGILLAALAGWFFYRLTWLLLLIYLSFVAATILDAVVHPMIKLGLRRGFAAVILMVGGLLIVSTILYFLGAGMYSQISAVSNNLERTPQRINDAVNGFKHHFMHAKPQGGKTVKNGPAHAVPTPSSAPRAPASPPVPTPPAPPTPRPPASSTLSPTALPLSTPTLPEPATEASATAASRPTTAPASAPATAPGDFDVTKSLADAAPDLTTVGENALRSVKAVWWLVICFFIVLYMLVDGPDHLREGRGLLPKHTRLGATKLFNELARAHRGWALASLANVCSATALTGTGLFLLGIPGAFILGFFAGLGELIPTIGPIAGAVPALLLTLIAKPEMFFYVCVMFVIVQTIQAYTISPMMLRFSIEMPVLVTIVSVLMFGTLFGFLGILVAIPFVADMVVVWDYVARLREKDAEDYDTINAPAGARRAVAVEHPIPAKLRKLLRRKRGNEE